EDFVGYLWLIIFPEAFINGMVISALVVFCRFATARKAKANWSSDITPLTSYLSNKRVFHLPFIFVQHFSA
ncbi:hypothetical protein Q6266_29895, partial [Klebsiella variicola]